MYDIIIVGAGVAGLRAALECIKINQKLRILVLEKYAVPGGRMETIKTKVGTKSIQYESGAGRIHSSHSKLLALIKHYGFHTLKLSKDTLWRPYKSATTVNNFDDLWFSLCEVFEQMPEHVQRTTTLRELAMKTMGPESTLRLLDQYPYRAELETASAASSIDLFKSLHGGYFVVVKEGFSALAEAMYKDAKSNGVTFKFNTDVMRTTYDPKSQLHTIRSDKGTYETKRVIFAVPQKALQSIHPFSPDNMFVKAVRMEPLLRIYSVYPSGDWFPPAKLVTNTPLRYIIPINPSQGLIMSSYLDSRDIELWSDLHKKENNERLKMKIQNETQALFPELTIPPALYTKAHLWRDGCSYWLPNEESYKELSHKALDPLPDHPNLHLIGESYSTKQQWIEGALEHADTLVAAIKENLTQIQNVR
jgi:monoamine oxidase